MVKVNVKWGKKKLDDIELNLQEPPAVFKTQLFTLTGVLPERQKILVKGGTLKDDADWSTLGIKDGHTFMMMGSAEAEIPAEPVQKTVFMEDLPEGESLPVGLGIPGLTNLGNTCYMNSTLQCLRALPELHSILKTYPGTLRETDPANNITASMRDLFNTLGNTNQSIPPLVFLQALRTAFPQFAQRGNNGQFMQQDAEECWSQLVYSLSQKLPKLKGANEAEDDKQLNSAVAQLLSGEMTSTLTNTEADEPKKVQTDIFFKLPCHISKETAFLTQGIKESLEEKITKQSESLNREAVYQKTSRISRLPYYLTVQFVRFFWKQGNQVKAKIVKPVEFPFTLDLNDFCTDDLKAQIAPKRKQLIELEEQRFQDSLKRQKEGGAKQEESSNVSNNNTKKEPVMDPAQFANESAMYELFAVLSHKGRMADAGHYVAWIKEAEDKWLKFDDDVVSMVNNEEIKKLSGKGGGDWHMAYLLAYRTKKVE